MAVWQVVIGGFNGEEYLRSITSWNSTKWEHVATMKQARADCAAAVVIIPAAAQAASTAQPRAQPSVGVGSGAQAYLVICGGIGGGSAVENWR